MSAGAVSTSLAELQRWGVVRRVWRPGERKDFFEAETDFWKMISRVVNERERALAESVRSRLEEAEHLAERAPRSARRSLVLERLERLLSLARIATAVLDSFVRSQHADFHEFGNVLTLARAKVARRRR
jgi:DNA-binding transcriptional regulator GbsR (MarR family)